MIDFDRDRAGAAASLAGRCLAALAGTALAAGLAAAAEPADLARGEYLAQIMDCAGCHMPRGADGAPIVEAGLSGGTIGFEMPGLGIFWPPNLTPDATGLGGWSPEDIAAAVREGRRPDGRMLAPVMPWHAYSALSDADAVALAAFLAAQAPVEHAVPGPLGAGEPAPAPFYRVVLPQ